MKRIKLTESEFRRVIKESVSRILTEISPELVARAYVGANVDYDDLNNSNEVTALNKNGQKVHRDTQKARRERQKKAFSQKISSDLSKKLGRNVKIYSGRNGEGDDAENYYYGEINRGQNPIYHHYSYANGNDPTNSYHDKIFYDGGSYDKKINHSDMNAADYISDFTDAMAGYHDELTGGKQYKNRMNRINDRISDVENIQKYKKDMQDYEDAERQHNLNQLQYNSLPWYKKIGKKNKSEFTRKKPKFPDLQTGPYFMPDNPEGLMQQAERTKSNRQKNTDKYNKLLQRK